MIHRKWSVITFPPLKYIIVRSNRVRIFQTVCNSCTVNLYRPNSDLTRAITKAITRITVHSCDTPFGLSNTKITAVKSYWLQLKLHLINPHCSSVVVKTWFTLLFAIFWKLTLWPQDFIVLTYEQWDTMAVSYTHLDVYKRQV